MSQSDSRSVSPVLSQTSLSQPDNSPNNFQVPAFGQNPSNKTRENRFKTEPEPEKIEILNPVYERDLTKRTFFIMGEILHIEENF